MEASNSLTVHASDKIELSSPSDYCEKCCNATSSNAESVFFSDANSDATPVTHETSCLEHSHGHLNIQSYLVSGIISTLVYTGEVAHSTNDSNESYETSTHLSLLADPDLDIPTTLSTKRDIIACSPTEYEEIPNDSGGYSEIHAISNTPNEPISCFQTDYEEIPCNLTGDHNILSTANINQLCNMSPYCCLSTRYGLKIYY